MQASRGAWLTESGASAPLVWGHDDAEAAEASAQDMAVRLQAAEGVAVGAEAKAATEGKEAAATDCEA